MNWRSIKRQARQQVDATMRLPCWRVSIGGSVTLTYARLTVARTNVTNDFAGELESLGYAERANVSPKLIVMRDRVPDPAVGDLFLFEEDEAYGVEDVRPPDDITVTLDCYRALPRQLYDSLDALDPVERGKIVFPVPEAP
ncbi:hypothetical protein ADP64_000020 [Achromobacter phage phiAxp-2]|uniref:Uncharacterized protein n=1 Tax=Achromobacter phage phiAxp-2 TaxID=1664246 RepID=A0A0K2FHL1_9CAUD|nr:hypothetical protein ADP64_000020 [Achromobacter phage phiAxp-2]ALA45450.1 hypothetical protein ADP64_000020 [Achromobacter phage phiAxp-2]